MIRAMLATTACVILLISGAYAHAGENDLLNKKDSLKEDDKGYQPGKGVDKLTEPEPPAKERLPAMPPPRVNAAVEARNLRRVQRRSRGSM